MNMHKSIYKYFVYFFSVCIKFVTVLLKNQAKNIFICLEIKAQRTYTMKNGQEIRFNPIMTNLHFIVDCIEIKKNVIFFIHLKADTFGNFSTHRIHNAS